jgi:UV DNA damage endonuclease
MRLGYACINMGFSNLSKSKRITTNRGMIKRTFLEKGLPYASELALQNCKDLLKIIQWNEQNNINFYRISSNIFPWASEYKLEQLPDFEEICKALKQVGDFATKVDQRLTFHPGPFNKLAAKEERIVKNTIKDLEHHSEIFDLMGFIPSYYNKINIHIGAAYEDKRETAYRFCKNFDRLSDNLKKRLTVENDDKLSLFTTRELYRYMFLDIGSPIVFDYHHHALHPGSLRVDEALDYAMETWGEITPVCHLSESRREEQQNDCMPQAHSDYVYTPIATHGHKFDLMIEAKAKELALLKYKKILLTSKKEGDIIL